MLAGPGSGKTLALTRRIAYRVATGLDDPDRTLVTTFSRRAARELAERLAKVGVRGPTITTLHGLAAASLTQAWRDEGVVPWGLTRYPLRLLAPLVRAHPAAVNEGPGLARWVAGELSWASARDLTPDDYVSEVARTRRSTRLPSEVVAHLFSAYQAEKKARRVLDVDDLLAALRLRLAADPAFADRLRWRFRHVAVDEAQDLSRGSFRLLKSIVGEEGDLLAVGDPDQAIYGFAGADARILQRLGEAVHGVQVLRMERAHRCPPGVLAAARSCMDYDATPATVNSLTSATGDIDPTVAVLRASDGADESHMVIRSLRHAHNGGLGWSDMAVLARTNAGLRAVAAACAAANIPVRSQRPLMKRPEVSAILDDIQERLHANTPAAQAIADVEQLADQVGRLYTQLRDRAADWGVSPSELSCWRDTELGMDLSVADLSADLPFGLADRVLDPGVSDSLEELVDLLEDYRRLQPFGRLDGLLVWLSAVTESRGSLTAPVTPGVDLVTFHRAKGLEWRLVHVVDAHRDTPVTTRAEAEEERRLRYVALTRARRSLVLTWQGTTGRPRPAWLSAVAEAATQMVLPRPGAPGDLLRLWREAEGKAPFTRGKGVTPCGDPPVLG